MSKLKYDRSVFITRADGSKQRIRVRGNNRKEVESRIAEIRFQEQSGLLTFNSNTPFSVWMEEWLEIYKKPKVTSGTYNEICGIMQRCFGKDLGSMKISDIRLPHVQKCLNAMEGYSKSYIHRAYIYIKACFQKAWEAEMISRSASVLKNQTPRSMKSAAPSQRKNAVIFWKQYKHTIRELFSA